MALVNGASCTIQTLRNYCKFFYESNKKQLAMVLSEIQMNDLGPSLVLLLKNLRYFDTGKPV